MQKLAFLPDELRIPILKEIGRTLRLKYRKVLNLGVDYGFSIKDLSSSVEHINHFLVKCSSYNLKEHEMFLDNLGINSLEGIESLHTGIEYSKNKPKSMICNIEKVKHLYVTKNSISKLENYLFLNFSTLKSLHLADNKIRMIKPDSLSGLGNLEYLSLANNELTNFDPRILQHTPNLQGINLCSNYLKNTQELEEAIKKEFPQDYGIHIYLDSQKECPKEEKEVEVSTQKIEENSDSQLCIMGYTINIVI